MRTQIRNEMNYKNKLEKTFHPQLPRSDQFVEELLNSKFPTICFRLLRRRIIAMMYAIEIKPNNAVEYIDIMCKHIMSGNNFWLRIEPEVGKLRVILILEKERFQTNPTYTPDSLFFKCEQIMKRWA